MASLTNQADRVIHTGYPQRRLNFRNATRADALCIGALGTQVFLDTYATQGIRETLAHEVLEHFSLQAITALIAEPLITFILVEADNHLIGFAQLRRDAAQPLIIASHAVELQRLYVQRRFHGHGIGKRLLQHVEAWAAEHSATSVWLTAWSGNGHAREFYSRQGYRDAGATHYVFRGETFENRVFVRTFVGSASSVSSADTSADQLFRETSV
jgi:diamine N-acetyltransferase